MYNIGLYLYISLYWYVIFDEVIDFCSDIKHIHRSCSMYRVCKILNL